MRAFDIFFSFIGILIILPLFIIVSVIVKISSPGPVIYSQERVGHNGKLFCLYKFRSMVVNADQLGTSITTGTDPRITRIGKFIRKTKIDELPQLWNVLKGDMSFVGPRPDVPEIVENYDSEMKRILDVRPGITSNATLYLRNEEDLLSLAKDSERAYMEIFIPAKVNLAMEHVNKKSALFDLGVLLQTVWALTAGRIWPLREDPMVSKIKEQIQKLNTRT